MRRFNSGPRLQTDLTPSDQVCSAISPRIFIFRDEHHIIEGPHQTAVASGPRLNRNWLPPAGPRKGPPHTGPATRSKRSHGRETVDRTPSAQMPPKLHKFYPLQKITVPKSALRQVPLLAPQSPRHHPEAHSIMDVPRLVSLCFDLLEFGNEVSRSPKLHSEILIWNFNRQQSHRRKNLNRRATAPSLINIYAFGGIKWQIHSAKPLFLPICASRYFAVRWS